MTDLKTFNIMNFGALIGGVSLASVEMILGIAVLSTALIYNIFKIMAEIKRRQSYDNKNRKPATKAKGKNK